MDRAIAWRFDVRKTVRDTIARSIHPCSNRGFGETAKKETRLGAVQCVALLTLKPHRYSEIAHPIALRHAALKSLDPLEWAACYQMKRGLFEAIQPSLFELRLDKRLWGHSPQGDGRAASNRHLYNRISALGQAQPAPKARPKRLFSFS